MAIVNVTNVFNKVTERQAMKFDLGKVNKGGAYDVCYCQHYEGCNNDLHYFQLAGYITVAGAVISNIFFTEAMMDTYNSKIRILLYSSSKN